MPTISVNGKRYQVVEMVMSHNTGVIFKTELRGKFYNIKIPRKYDGNSTWRLIEDEIKAIKDLKEKMPSWHPNLVNIVDYSRARVFEDLIKEYPNVVPDEGPYPAIVSDSVPFLREKTFDITNEWTALLVDMLSAHTALEMAGYDYSDLRVENIGYNPKTNRYLILYFGHMEKYDGKKPIGIYSFKYPFEIMENNVKSGKEHYTVLLKVLRGFAERVKSYIHLANLISWYVPIPDFWITDINSIRLYRGGEEVDRVV